MSAIKSAFFIDLSRNAQDLSFDLTDRAVSGTDTLLLRVAGHFAIESASGLVFTTLAPTTPHERVLPARNLHEAYMKASDLGCGKLVFIADHADSVQITLLAQAVGGPELVPWLQNTPNLAYLDKANSSLAVRALVCVSNTQAFSLAWHKVYPKLVVIPNFIDAAFWAPIDDTPSDELILYVGALVPTKGFQHLAHIWPKVHQQFPRARLVVCGSPNLHRTPQMFGANGIAEPLFEHQILSPLGGSRSSAVQCGVTFVGATDKAGLRMQLSRARAVVVNPNTKGSYETFCVSAVEALAMGKAVLGGAAGALPETVGHQRGGLLAKHQTELFSNVCKLLADRQRAIRLGNQGREWVLARYVEGVVLPKWDSFLNNDTDGNPLLRPEGDEFKPRDYWARSFVRSCLSERQTRIAQRIFRTLA